jgi:hypothetical protein
VTTAPDAVRPAPAPAVDAAASAPRRLLSGAGARLALLGFGAFAVRGALVLVVRNRHEYGFDATWYHAVAGHLARGDGYVVGSVDFAGGFAAPFTDLQPTALFPPLYPAVLAAGSLAGLDTPVGHQVVACVLGSLTVVLVAVLAARVAGDTRVGLVAGVLAAVHPLLVGADVAMMSEPLYGLLGVAALIVVLRLRARPSVAAWVVLGAALAGAAVTRSEGLLLAGAVIAVAALGAGRAATASGLGARGPGPARARWAGAAVAAAIVVVAAGGWMVRNAARTDASFVLATNTGATLAGANCDLAYAGAQIGSWDIRCIDFDAWSESGASEAEFFAGLRRQGIDYAREHVTRWPVVVAARVGRLLSLVQPVQQLDVTATEGRHRPVELAGVGLDYALGGMAIAGLVLAARRAVWIVPLLVPGAVALVSAAAVYGSPRFRHAFEPTIVVGAAIAAVALWDRRGAQAARRRSPAGARS